MPLLLAMALKHSSPPVLVEAFLREPLRPTSLTGLSVGVIVMLL